MERLRCVGSVQVELWGGLLGSYYGDWGFYWIRGWGCAECEGNAGEEWEQKVGQNGVAHEVKLLGDCKGSFSLAAFET